MSVSCGYAINFSNFGTPEKSMPETSRTGDQFLDKAQALVLENLSNEQFGVSELAAAMNMSRSSLLRKVKKNAGLSASQFIRQIRLKRGMELLKQDDTLTVSEISHQVGFGSTSYFIKCFREQYGIPPGEVSKSGFTEEPVPTKPSNKRFIASVISVILIGIAVSVFLYNKKPAPEVVTLEKSIAVLPFKNQSSDSANVYFVNGLMESTLSNLQKIGDFRVVSRTSSEKFRNTDRSIPEIAEELRVNYVVEGSGQRVGDKVLLNIQLIEAATDRPVWSEQYNREVVDIFALQNEVAREIADAVSATVTPAELEQIDKKPTDNLPAYDYYLQGLDFLYGRTREGIEQAIQLFEKAIELDPQFSLAYANVAISYYFLDEYQKQKQYTEQINTYADKALLYDSKSAESLMSKALYYIHIGEFNLAVPHLEKALEYNPNSSGVVQMLGDLYARAIPNTGKYLQYALKGIQLDVAGNDSITQSYIYLHLSNALVQSGFVNEAMTYINKSLDYDPGNYYAPLVKIYISHAQNGDIAQTGRLLEAEFQKDTTRLDIMQEVAKMYYFQEHYDSAYFYYEKFVNARDRLGLEMYPQEDIKIGVTYEKMGLERQAEEFFSSYAEYCERDESIYKSASTAVKYVHEGKYDAAIEQLKIFATQDNYQYWILLFIEEDPIMNPLKSHPEYKAVIRKIRERFWENQAVLKKSLEEKGLI